ncbi:A/G-specific adenine DNA glycosylase-like protein [Perkinsela sp. CCAP 1560/4]|nr:A/G-specific adenine DNA glycosylase-like protein [Perkinsela sp. CCAP 1560/4]|eukprot:KNH05904.1 A/G-specific adenine DNA glycosylase-like protein [Perkinsela sp. CCAP 1560/4]
MYAESKAKIALSIFREIEVEARALEALQSRKREVIRLLSTESSSLESDTSPSVLGSIVNLTKDGSIPASCSLKRTEWLDGEDSMCEGITSPMQPSRFQYSPLLTEGNFTRDESSEGCEHDMSNFYRLGKSLSTLRKKSIERFLVEESGRSESLKRKLEDLRLDYANATYLDRECAKKASPRNFWSADAPIETSVERHSDTPTVERRQASFQRSIEKEENSEYGTDEEDSRDELSKLHFVQYYGLDEYLCDLRKNLDEEISVLFEWIYSFSIT